MDLKKLKEPFEDSDIEWRISMSGETSKGPWCQVLAYITNRAVMDRLDEVCGPENWKNEYSPAPDGGVLCGISIRVDNEWITKWDGAENTIFEAIKGGLSSAMKRAVVNWGIGRYLYNLDATWPACCYERKAGYEKSKIAGGKYLYWLRPSLPVWALPGGSGKPLA